MQSAHAQQPQAEQLVNVAIRKPLHRQVKAVAALQGLTLQEYVQRTLESSIPNHLGMPQQNGKTRTTVPVDPTA